MAETARRRGHHEDSIYFDVSKNRWVGATSLGFSPDGERRIRQKVRGRTKAEVRDKLQALHRDVQAGSRVSASTRGVLRPGLAHRRTGRWLHRGSCGQINTLSKSLLEKAVGCPPSPAHPAASSWLKL
jgi:hypothetical protein